MLIDMRMYKKLLASIVSAIVFVFSVTERVGAQGQFILPNPSRYGSLEDIINAVGGLVRFIVVVTLIIALMIGGWTRLTSQGEPDKIAKSQKIMVAAVIGFIIIVLAPVIVDFVGRLIGVQGGLLSLGGVT